MYVRVSSFSLDAFRVDPTYPIELTVRHINILTFVDLLFFPTIFTTFFFLEFIMCQFSLRVSPHFSFPATPGATNR